MPTCANLLATSGCISFFDVAAAIAAILALRIAIHTVRRNLHTTCLRGPPRKNFLFGYSMMVAFGSSDTGSIYEEWAKEYGPAYAVPTMFGGKKIMLCDTKAIAHYCARETQTYVHPNWARRMTLRIFGKGILWAEGEAHKRQRKSLTPAFSRVAIRNLTPIFYNSAHKTKSTWESMIDASDDGSAIIEVQNWMNHISLDTIGLAGFSHDFGSLDGKPAAVTKLFDTFGESPGPSPVSIVQFLLAQVFPILPIPGNKLLKEMQEILGDISKSLLERTKKEKEGGVLNGQDDKSIMGVLLKAKDAVDSELHLTAEETISQMKTFIFAGYETTSISLTWALIELAQNSNVQSKLRQELVALGGDPTYDQLTNGLPYLDAVVHETLRFHPPVTDSIHVAAEDDVIPLSQPMHTRSGGVVDSIAVARGTQVEVSFACINRSVALWGPNAKMFWPARWLDEDGIPEAARNVQGYRHLMTLGDGPRACLGKGFAVTEFKAVLSVLVKNFIFEMRDGPDTQVEMNRGMFPRPKVVGEKGSRVPLRVSRYDG